MRDVFALSCQDEDDEVAMAEELLAAESERRARASDALGDGKDCCQGQGRHTN